MVVFKKPFVFGTKAETLERLGPRLTRSAVPEFLHFTVEEWNHGDRDRLLAGIAERFARADVIVRSSASTEDGSQEAQAGAFLSVPDVPAASRERLSEAIERVVASYRERSTTTSVGEDDPRSQVIVQRMIGDVLLSGVLFTQDLSTGAPYYVINYDDETGRTETIAAGTGYANRTLYVLRDAVAQLTSPRFQRVLEAVREIEALVGGTCLDIEFALDRDLQVQLFQVRQITTQPNWNRGVALRITDMLSRLQEGLAQRYWQGDPDGDDEPGGGVLGNMPDWNPAEMIGTTPRKLALSLYRTLITDRAWRVARRVMGYRENRGMPLMMSLAGQPYVDVRESFRSYLPASLPEEIGRKLVSAWLRRLRDHPHLHDKVEFDVAVTAYAPDFEWRVKEQFPEALSPDEVETFRNHLCKLTADLLAGRVAPIDDQLNRIELLAQRRGKIVDRSSRPTFEMLSELLEDAVEFGTIPFSVLARHGFIASSMLRALVVRGVMSQSEVDAFQRSVATVATGLVVDVSRTVKGELGEAEFLERYGHLRPGTYDILSMRYDQRLAGLAGFAPDRRLSLRVEEFVLRDDLRSEIDRLLEQEGLGIDAEALLAYCRAAMQGREYAKLVFTHNVSDALEIIAALGERHGLSREELSYVGIRDFLDAFIEPGGRSIESHLRALSESGRESHEVTNSIRLPSLITRVSDLVIVPLAVEQPNFITRKNTRGEVVLLQGADLDPERIDGKIVAIRSADPGFDWIFSRRILGLLTKYGGANSHMAIRCAEFGLPAAIGCGEQIFERAVGAGRVELNCAEGQILDA
jgi:hypothetical protein